MHALHRPSLALWIVLLGCEPTAELSVTIGDPVEVDTRCDSGCNDQAMEVQVSLAEDARANAEVEILQYRVEYELSGVEEVPFYADRTSLNVSVDEPVTRS